MVADSRGPFMFRRPTPRDLAGLAAVALGAAALAGAAAWALARPEAETSGSPPPAEAGEAVPTPSPLPGTGPLDDRRARIGELAPDFALLDVRDERTLRRLSDYRGKVVLLNWYASWCGPCRREIPLLQRAAEALPDDLVVLGVDLQEPFAQARDILEVLGGRYPAVLDSNGEVADRYGLRGLPTTFVIDREGRIVGVRAGELTETTLRGLLAKAGLTLPADQDGEPAPGG